MGGDATETPLDAFVVRRGINLADGAGPAYLYR